MSEKALFSDVIFPQNLPFLTYRIPDGLSGKISPGQLIAAPLRGCEKKGVVLRVYESSDPGGYEDISGVITSGLLYSPELLSLIEWASDYYLTNHGTLLKAVLPKELLNPPKRLKVLFPKMVQAGPSFPDLSDEETGFIEQLGELTDKKTYRTLLYHSPSGEHEVAFILEVIKRVSTALILTPETRDADNLYTYVKASAGDAVAIYHSRMGRTARYNSINGIHKGTYGILIGTGSSVFAPLRSPGVIIVMREHHTLYKQEGSPRCNARDIAVMRGFLEKTPVLLTSVTPSLESLYNCMRHKYRLLKPSFKGRKPFVSIIRPKKGKGASPYLSRAILRALKPFSRDECAGTGAMVILQRRGYSMIRCEECGHIEACPYCTKPLVLYRSRGLLCNYCRYRMDAPLTCSSCKGYRLSSFGAGTERVIEDLKRELGADSVFSLKDSCQIRGPEAGVDSETDIQETPYQRVVVGTARKGDLRRQTLSAIFFLNPDILLNLPEIRRSERLLQDIFSLGELLSEGGTLYLQTDVPWHPVYTYIKKWDYTGFAKKEFELRRRLNMPPYTNLVSIMIYAGTEKTDPADEIREVVDATRSSIAIDGPINVVPKLKRFTYCHQLMLRDKDRQRLKEYARLLQGLLNKRGFILRIDVDPVLF